MTARDKRQARIVACVVGVLGVAALVIGLTVSSDAGQIAALVLGSVAGVLAVGAGFYAAGVSEDRARERDERER